MSSSVLLIVLNMSTGIAVISASSDGQQLTLFPIGFYYAVLYETKNACCTIQARLHKILLSYSKVKKKSFF